jgi:hypothetical protein
MGTSACRRATLHFALSPTRPTAAVVESPTTPCRAVALHVAVHAVAVAAFFLSPLSLRFYLFGYLWRP